MLGKSQNWLEAEPSAQSPLQKQDFGDQLNIVGKQIFDLSSLIIIIFA